MSDSDSFIDEVAEEVRRDRLFAVMRKYGWIGIAAVLLIVGGAAYNELQKSRRATSAENFGDGVLAALGNDDAAGRVTALAGVGAAEGQGAIRDFILADAALDNGDTEAALAALTRVAGDATLDDTYRQLAHLKIVILRGPALDAAERDALLITLAQPGAPFRPLAMEQQALVHVAAGETTEAVAVLRQILQEANVTAGLRNRATQLIVALGEDPEAG